MPPDSPHTEVMPRFLGSALFARCLAAVGSCALLGLAACGQIGGVSEGDTGGTGGSSSAAGSGSGGTPQAVVLPPEPAFKVVGYQPSWAGSVLSLPYSQLNYVNYAFAIEKADGSIGLPQGLVALVANAHPAGTRVLLSVGGWNNGDASAFVALSANPTARAAFVAACLSAVDTYSLDGIDIDWEFPSQADAPNFAAMMHDLSAALTAKGKILTIAVSALEYGTEAITPEIFGYIDFANIMAYDGGGRDGSGHSPYSYAQSALAFWLNTKHLPASKAVLGIPFYSRPGYIAYSAIVKMSANAMNTDTITTSTAVEYYNGIPTVQQKTALAMTMGGGVMAWDLSQDTHDADSLLSAMVTRSKQAP